MKKVIPGHRIHFPKWQGKQPRGSRPTLGADERGITTALVALLLFALLLSFAFLIDITGMLIRRQQMQTMAEFGSAAGGRFVAELIAAIAEQNVQNNPCVPYDPPGCFNPPRDDERKHPERYLYPEQREFVQNDPGVRAEVVSAARTYVELNRPKQVDAAKFSVDPTYPAPYQDCQGSKRTVDIRTEIGYTYPFILGRLVKPITSRDELRLKVSGLYSVRLCP